MDLYRKHVQSDCEELLNRFQKTQSVRFEDFSNIWREIKFSQIFWGTASYNIRPFSRLALDTAYGYFLPPFSFQIRVGGLYLLYSLYHTQTASPAEQIRLPLKDWEDVKKFEKDALEAQHLDVVYVLRQLMSCKAFAFTAAPTELVFKRKRNKEKPVLCEQFFERTSRPQELIGAELLEEMTNVSELYEKMKMSTVSQMGAGDVSSFTLVHTDLVSRLRSAVLDFYNSQQENAADGEGGQQEAGSSQPECLRRAERLRAIKFKAFSEAAEALKSRRHRQVELNLSAENAETSTRSGHSKVYKPTLRFRTNETVHVSGDMWKEARGSTKINRLVTLDPASDGKIKNVKKVKHS